MLKEKLISDSYLGIEFGSTRIKAVLLSEAGEETGAGVYDWENDYENGYWTYSEEKIIKGMQSCYADLKKNVKNAFGVTLRPVKAIGISAMMHGYLPLDKNGNILTPFRTWRNTVTEKESEKLTALFDFNIPQRWSIAHLERAIDKSEDHVKDIDLITTLAGYIHFRLTGEKVLGIGDASGVFPIDTKTKNYNRQMMAAFDESHKEDGLPFALSDILPEVLPAGVKAGCLTPDGAKLLDTDGDLLPGVPFCPPEGDAGTGMAATNAVKERTGNVSAGTSVFSMIVLEKNLEHHYPEIDIVTTPEGKNVAMVHCNNCTGDIDAYVGLMREILESFGVKKSKAEVYDMFYSLACGGDDDAGGVVSYNFFADEPVLHTVDAKPMLIRDKDSAFNLKNLARSLVFSAVSALKAGHVILEKENVAVDTLLCHGGLFKSGLTALTLFSGVTGVKVGALEHSGEGGAYGMAVLARYLDFSKKYPSLSDYLEKDVFASSEITTVEPEGRDVEGYAKYYDKYTRYLKRYQMKG